MRANHYLPVAILLSMTVVSSAFAQSGIRWMHNLDEARQVAQRDGRLILMHFYTNSCGPCRMLERNVFPRTDVAASMMRNYVPVLIDAQRFPNVAAHFQVDRYPTDIITDASGQRLFRGVTPQDPKDYIRLLDGFASDHRFATPGYAVGSRGAAEDPNRFAGRPYQPNPPQNQDQQHQFSQSVPPGGQRSYGYGYGGSVPPNPGLDGARGGFESRSMPGQFARESQYGPRYADQAPGGAQPPAPTYTPPQPPPRETYNPHITPPNGLSRSDVRSQAPGYQGQGSSSRASDYGGTYQPSESNRKSGWQMGPSQYAGQGSQPDGANVGQGIANPRLSMADGRESRFTSTPVAPRSQESPLALDGFCPVTLAANEAWQQGDPQWGAVHRGRTYLFTSQRFQQMFLGDPDRYSPMLSGCDPVRYVDRQEVVPGLRQHGMWFGGKMYLFADEPSLERFGRSPDYFAQRAHDIMMRAGR